MEIALSSAEMECVALSSALWKDMPIMKLLKEMSAVAGITDCDKSMKYIMLYDKNGTIELTRGSKMRPIINHAVIKY